MKNAILAACLAVFVFGLSAQEKNLLGSKWNIYSGSKTTVIDQKTGVITCKNPEPGAMAGVVQTITLNQKSPAAICFSGESKAQDVKGTAAGNYCLYADVHLADGTHVWGRVALFKPGTHDWEKAEFKYTPEKPIKSVSFYVLFRKMTGEASFRNIIFTEGK